MGNGDIMKINRLLEITILLLNKQTTTARELSDRFGVSTRTIYRDLDVLSSAGVPVYTNKGNGGGISLMENYSLNKTIISEQESEGLLLALKTLQATKYPQIDGVLDKIGALFKNIESEDWVHIEFLPWSSSPNEYNKFTDIKKAILERKVIGFDYANSVGERCHRLIEPMRLLFKGQAWYLWGFCRNKMDFRTFRISRIKNVKLTAESFERRGFEESNKKELMGYPLKEVHLKLKFYPQAIHRLFDDFDDSLITKDDDGNYIVNVTFPEDEWVYGFILSFGCNVEVLEPKHIKQIISDRAVKILEIYNK